MHIPSKEVFIWCGADAGCGVDLATDTDPLVVDVLFKSTVERLEFPSEMPLVLFSRLVDVPGCTLLPGAVEVPEPTRL
jgi:hypothetical protein